MENRTGLFVVLEGMQGSGKTTTVELLQAGLNESGAPAVVQKYPSNGPIGSMLRTHLINDPQDSVLCDLSPEAMGCLYLSDMLLTRGRIRDLVADGTTVLCDRYFPSTMVYQYLERMKLSSPESSLVGINKLLSLFIQLTELPTPDVLVWFMLPLHVVARRVYDRENDPATATHDRNDKADSLAALELKLMPYWQAYLGLFRQMASKLEAQGVKIVVIQEEKPLTEVCELVLDAMIEKKAEHQGLESSSNV